MPKQKTIDEAYCDCETDGYIAPLEIIDTNKIESMLALAQTIYDTAQDVKKNDPIITTPQSQSTISHAL